MNNLISENNPQVFLPSQAKIAMYSNFFGEDESNQMFSHLHQNIQWKQKTIFLYGKKIAIPRLTAWYGDQEKSYTYSKIKMEPCPWIPVLDRIKTQVEKVCDKKFNSVLLNLYRDGSDSISWHSDDEKELGQSPVIASLSLGSERCFMLRHKTIKAERFNIELTNGSLLVMGGETQIHWQHQIPKTKSQVKPRINLTFREIY